METYGSGNSSGPASDPFSKFWMDCMAKFAGSGFTSPSGGASDEAMKQMRRAFFDAWANHCEEFMRSPAFLEAMKRSMDNALAFREQLNEFLTRALHEGQAPARSDTDSIMLVLRSFEDRVLDRLDRLEKRVARVEEGTGVAPPVERSPAAAGAGRRSKGGNR